MSSQRGVSIRSVRAVISVSSLLSRRALNVGAPAWFPPVGLPLQTNVEPLSTKGTPAGDRLEQSDEPPVAVFSQGFPDQPFFFVPW